MIFCFYFSVSWILLFFLFFKKEIVQFKQLSFIFLVVCLIHTHLYILIPENFKGFIVSEKIQLYLAFVLDRTIIVPAFLVLIYRVFYRKNIFITSIFCGIVLALLDFAGELVGVYKYMWWNIFWAFIYYWLLSFIPFYMSGRFSKMEEDF